MRSQNLVFNAIDVHDEHGEHPPGLAVARHLQSRLGDYGWRVTEPDNWRDCGWSLKCSRERSLLEVTLAVAGGTRPTVASAWMLQIAPMHQPGILGRALGKPPSASPADCYALATAVHEVLSSNARFSGLRWRWDNPPDDATSTSAPPPPPNKS